MLCKLYHFNAMFLKFLSHMMNIRGSLLSQLTFYTSMLLSEHLFKKLSLTTKHPFFFLIIVITAVLKADRHTNKQNDLRLTDDGLAFQEQKK